MTRPDDRVGQSLPLVEAEESGVTKEISHRMGTTNVFGDIFENMFRNAVSANGNYGELWDKNTPFQLGEQWTYGTIEASLAEW
jgi:hypothetical protein